MGSPDRVRRRVQQDFEEDVEVNIDVVRDDDDGDGYDKRKSRSNKSRRSGNIEELDGLDGSGRKRSDFDRHESRKRVSGSSKDYVDQDDYDARKESRKQARKSEENMLDKLSTWYQDGEEQYNFDGAERSGSRGHSRAEDSEKRKPTSKYSEQNVDVDKKSDRELRYTERRDGGREKRHGSVEHGRSSRKKWDESINSGKADEYMDKLDTRTGNLSDPIHENARERIDTVEIQSVESKSKGLESMTEIGIKSHDREDRRVDSGRSKRGRHEASELNSSKSLMLDDNSSKEFKPPRISTQDIVENSDRNVDEDASLLIRDRSKRDVNISSRARTPEKTVKREYESNEMDERSTNSGRKELANDVSFDDRSKGRDDSWGDRNRERKEQANDVTFDDRSKGRDDNWGDRNRERKEQANDVSFDDRSKGRDDSWGDRNRERDNLKDSRKVRHDKETRDGESNYDSGRDWESRRHRDWPEGDSRYHGRSVGRKDGNRTEAVKISSKYGISSNNYDVIEINTRSFDYGREDSRSVIVNNSEHVQQPDAKLAPEVDDLAYSRDPRSRSRHGSVQSGEDANERFMDGGPSKKDQLSWRDDNSFQTEKSKGMKGVEGNREIGGKSSTSGLLPPYGNQESSSYGRIASQGVRENRMGRGGRSGPPGRDGQQSAIQMPIVGSPFGPLGLPPPGPLQSVAPNMSPAPGPPISPGVFVPPFQHHIVWPGGRGIEMNMLAVPQGLPPVPPGPLGPRFPPNMGNQPNGSLFSPSGPGRGMPPSISGPNYNTIVPAIHGQSQDKTSGVWVPPRTNVPPGKAPSRGEQNDYSQNFVDTGMRPQNYIRELELTSVVEDYPKLRELIQRKDEIVAKSASPPMYFKCDLREQVLSPDFFGTKFDVILVDPPWEEYVHRAPGVTDHMEHWSFEEIMNLKIEAIADTPSFIFLWVGDGVGLEQGRQCLKKWGFRRCEDICWVKTNKTTATPGLRHDSHTLYQRTKEHCLMGIKGTVRRSTDGHIIHANIDTDVIIAEEPPYGSTAKPEDMYRIIEHFALGRRRLELFGEDHNIRSGWLTVGNGLTSSNFNAEQYVRNFADKDGKVWVGGGGRNPPPEAPHLALTTPEIESLRPKSPMKNQQQLAQQPSVAISLTTPTSGNKRPTGNYSPQHHFGPMNQEGPSSSMPSPAPWAASPMVRDGSHMPGDERFDMYGAPYNTQFGPGGDFFDYESHRGMMM